MALVQWCCGASYFLVGGVHVVKGGVHLVEGSVHVSESQGENTVRIITNNWNRSS